MVYDWGFLGFFVANQNIEFGKQWSIFKYLAKHEK